MSHMNESRHICMTMNELCHCQNTGVKQVPAEQLLHEKTYMFFSHTIKGQMANMPLLHECLRKKVTFANVRCSALQCIAVCNNILRCVAVCCGVLLHERLREKV